MADDYNPFVDDDFAESTDLTDDEPEPATVAATPGRSSDSIIFDIETGPRPEPALRKLYQEPTLEEFAGSCDSRWKPETVRAKWEDAKRNGWEQFVQKAALSPMTGTVVAIGYWERDFAEVVGVGQKVADGQVWQEVGLLAGFWCKYEAAKQARGRLVGFNIFGFDLPFLVRRSWLLGVEIPAEVIRDNRNWSRTFIDLMQVWGCGTREFTSLDKVSRYFGGTGKNGDGADFARLWNGTEEERKQAIAYLKNDCAMTATVARKMGVL